MFLKRLERRKNGKAHTYWVLVESIRTAQGSRQRVVAYLGELKKRERSGWAQFGQRLNGPGRPQPSLFDPPHYDDPTDDEPILAKIKSGDVVLPARMADGSHRTIHLRCVTTPDEALQVLLNRLGLTLPQCLRRIDEVDQM